MPKYYIAADQRRMFQTSEIGDLERKTDMQRAVPKAVTKVTNKELLCNQKDFKDLTICKDCGWRNRNQVANAQCIRAAMCLVRQLDFDWDCDHRTSERTARKIELLVSQDAEIRKIMKFPPEQLSYFYELLYRVKL
jgi:hypothetical protein